MQRLFVLAVCAALFLVVGCGEQGADAGGDKKKDDTAQTEGGDEKGSDTKEEGSESK